MSDQPPKYVSPPATWRTKVGLRAASLLFIIILAGLAGSLATTPRLEGSWSLMFILLFVPAIIITFLWDVAETISIFKRGGNRGIHPGAVVGVDLLLWLGWGLILLVMVTSATVARPRYMIEDYSGYDDYRYGYDPDKVTDEDKALEATILGKARAIVAFNGMTFIAHFALFVIGCYETNIRNRTPRTVYVMQPMYGQPQNMPAAYQQLGSYAAQPQHGQPMPMPMPMAPGQAYMQPVPGQGLGQFPAGPAPVMAGAGGAEPKGAERFA